MNIETTETPVYAPSVEAPKTSGAVKEMLAQWWVAFAASAVFVVSGHLIIKSGLNSLAPLSADANILYRLLHVALNPLVVLGLLIYVMGTVCWMRAVSQKDISFLYPLSSMNFVLIAGASMFFLGEQLSTQRIGGVLMVVLGMILMNTSSDGGSK